MKAKQLKNGTWTISGVSSETIVAVEKVLAFALKDDIACMSQEELRKKIEELRYDGNTFSLAFLFEGLFDCIRKHNIEK